MTELIVFNRMKMNISWAELALKVNKSKEWTTSALLGQHQMSKEEAEKVGTVLALPSVAVKLLQTVPYKGSLPTSVPTDPLIYRFYELVNVYGTTFKELIHEEFGDGIMSAIDFNMNLSKKKGDLGEDRVSITMSGSIYRTRSINYYSTRGALFSSGLLLLYMFIIIILSSFTEQGSAKRFARNQRIFHVSKRQRYSFLFVVVVSLSFTS